MADVTSEMLQRQLTLALDYRRFIHDILTIQVGEGSASVGMMMAPARL